jgi:LysR family transcriptional regulator, benzoate and cis,cis-muconate-responsive activator of ben and cat genes
MAGMELRHLRYFKAVAELLNFSRAAEQMHVAQPALSRQIQALEEELGARLLDRNRVRVQLTDAGRTFYAHSCKILAQVDLAVANVKEVKAGRGGELIICNDWRIASHLVPATLRAFQARYPHAEVVLRDLRIHEQLAALRAHRAHLGFVVHSELIPHQDLESIFVFKSDLLAVIPSSHPLAARRSLRLAELAGETWLSLDEKEAPGYRSHLIQICRLAGFTPHFGASTATIDGLLGRIASGYGIALAPEVVAQARNPLLRFVPTDCAPLEFHAVWHRQEKSVLLQEYLEILRAQVARSGPRGAALPRSRRAAGIKSPRGHLRSHKHEGRPLRDALHDLTPSKP